MARFKKTGIRRCHDHLHGGDSSQRALPGRSDHCLSLDELANRIQQITEQNSEDAHQLQGVSRTSTELAQRLYHISQG
ncbi:hypothetical protein [Cellvibrio polysaccharolyticus]|uniref:Uncharacterized protein n=1 Tax=Cellvibrio polysaccharolyticus TaxID=2082724 RepID=A0A928YV01_9GAMM|nr:hypothetical protein [Cellvibrio polysaccharolyticus]MBE8718512.1 hypothetical protein [Cellvibrio polysaccharolyticus]